MNGAQAVLRTLAASGVRACFANPGTSEMHLVAALDRAAEVAIAATREALDAHPEVEEARFWLFGDDAYAAFEEALA